MNCFSLSIVLSPSVCHTHALWYTHTRAHARTINPCLRVLLYTLQLLLMSTHPLQPVATAPPVAISGCRNKLETHQCGGGCCRQEESACSWQRPWRRHGVCVCKSLTQRLMFAALLLSTIAMCLQHCCHRVGLCSEVSTKLYMDRLSLISSIWQVLTHTYTRG